MVEESPEVSNLKQNKYTVEFLYDFGTKWDRVNEDIYVKLLKLKLLTSKQNLCKLKNAKLSAKMMTPNADTLLIHYTQDEHLMRVVNQYVARKEAEMHSKKWFQPAEKWAVADVPGEPEPSKSLQAVMDRIKTVSEVEKDMMTNRPAIPAWELAEFERIRRQVLLVIEHTKKRLNFLHETFPPSRNQMPNHYAQLPPQQQQPRFPMAVFPPQFQPQPQPFPLPQFQQQLIRPNGGYPPQLFQPQFQPAPPLPLMQNQHIGRPLQYVPPVQQPFLAQIERPRTESESTNNTLPAPPPSLLPKQTISKSHLKKIHKAQKQKTSKLSDEDILILSLLSLNAAQREEFIQREAKEHGIVQKASNGKGFEVTKKYRAIQPLVNRYALERVSCTTSVVDTARTSSDKAQNTEKVREEEVSSDSAKKLPKKDKERMTFEELVTMLVNDLEDLDDKSKIKYSLPVEKQDRKEMCDNKRTALIETMVKKLVEDKKGHLHTADIRIHAKNYAKAFVCDIEAQDVYISNPILRRNALHGDIVEVYVHHSAEVDPAQVDPELEDTKPKKLGFVTKIVEKRHNRQCVGTFEPFKRENKSSTDIFFTPRDSRMPTLRIPRQHWPNALLVDRPEDIENVLYLAEIIHWKKQKPFGSIIKSYGECGELVAETEALLGDLNVIPFPQQTIDQYQEMEFTIPDVEFEYREDLRKLCIFTIDPSTARDLDDAVSVKCLENGNYEVGVHISDVTYFFKENSFLDTIVKNKATTIYMVDQVYHMLPKPLCFICSLLPGEDKLAFSVIWVITSDGEVKATRFTRSVIHSCAQLSYDHAQAIIDTPDADCPEDFPQISGGQTFDAIRDAIKILYKISQHLRKKRFENGAIKIDRPKLWFDLDRTTRIPLKYGLCEQKEANRLIEEYMLLANISVAEFIYKNYSKTSILRAHAPPNANALDTLEATLKRSGITLEGRNSLNLRESMEKLIANSTSPNATRAVLDVMLSKPMQRAKYFCSALASAPEDTHHFGLATPIYTHFTSPIRRYADIMVHRGLSAALGYSAETERQSDELQLLANNCNEQKWSAKNAGQKCAELYFMHYIKRLGSIKMKAGVLSIGPLSMEVVLIDTDDCVKIWYRYLAPPLTVKFYDAKPTYVELVMPAKEPIKLTLFSEVTVEVEVQKNKLVINNILPPE